MGGSRDISVAAKWAAIGTLGLASVGGVAWSIATQPAPARIEPAASPGVLAAPPARPPAAPPAVTTPAALAVPTPALTPAPLAVPAAGMAPAPGTVITPAPAPAPVAPPPTSPSAASSARPQPPAAPGPRLIDLNTATAAELELLPGIGPALAARILEHRAAHGPFRHVEDLDRVKGIGPAKLAKIRPLVRVSAAPPR